MSFYPTSGGPDHVHREILDESKLQLVDRMYQPGDLLKRSIDDVRSGVVTGCVFSLSLSFCVVSARMEMLKVVGV